MNLILVALVLLTLTGCSSQPRILEVSAKPIEVVPLVLPEVDVIELGDLTFHVVNETNAQDVFDELLNKNYDPVIFGVTDVHYETLSVNQAKILQLVRQQKAVVIAYEKYYDRQHLHITENNKSARAQSSETEDSNGEEDDVDREDASFLKRLRTWKPW